MWPNPQKTADLVTFIEEILNWKLHFLCSEFSNYNWSPRSDIENNERLDEDATGKEYQELLKKAVLFGTAKIFTQFLDTGCC